MVTGLPETHLHIAIHGFVEKYTKPVDERNMQVLLNVASLLFCSKDNSCMAQLTSNTRVQCRTLSRYLHLLSAF
jgi:hypothetical protein